MSSPSEADQPLWSTIVDNTSRDDRSEIRRAWDPLVHPELGANGCVTLYEGFRRGAKLNPMGPCVGFRAVSTTGFATPFIYSTYTECLARIDALAAGFDTLGLLQPNEDGLAVMGLYLKNCMEWVMAEQATFAIGGCTAPLYDTLGPDTVHFILHQTSAKTVVSVRANLPHLCQAKASGECPSFTHVLLADGLTPEAAREAKLVGLEALSLAKVEAMGDQLMAHSGHRHRPPAPEDIATFCYTSGTTGNPKGALLTHTNIISTIQGVKRAINGVEGTISDRHLSYLPLAHIFERVFMMQIFLGGGSVAFFRGDPLLLIEDWQACRPTLVPVAPRVLNKIYDKIHAGIAAAGGNKKKLFDAAVAAKAQGLKHGHLKHALYDRLIFNKIKRGLGLDQVRFMISGSAPISDAVMIFFRCLLGVPIVEGYGQTEGAAGASIGHPDDQGSVGHVGGPVASCDVVLMDVPEMGYLHTDTEHRGQPCRGRGEICLRGPNVFKGYYKDEGTTKETIDEEGFLHSGDIGLWRPDGTLQIIDRKKNIFKLAQGEYVAPEKIENILTRSPLIAQIFVYGSSLQSTLVAIVVPDEEPVRQWAQTNEPSLATASLAQACQTRALKDAIMVEIRRLSKESCLQSFETIKAIYLEPEQFSVEKGFMTPTFKLKRQTIRDAYERVIDELYNQIPAQVSKL